MAGKREKEGERGRKREKERLSHTFLPRRFDVFISGAEPRPRSNDPQKNLRNLEIVTRLPNPFQPI